MVIRFTKKTHKPFSNFYEQYVTVRGITYRNGEAAFQHGKLLDKNSHPEFADLSPGQAKRLGRNILLRDDWEEIKFDWMVEVLMCKFSQDEYARELLLSTGYAWLVEDTTSWHDNIWGSCSCERCRNKLSKNMLGQALMIVRARLRGDNGVPIKITRMNLKFDLLGTDVEEEKNDGTWDSTLNMLNRFG